MKGLLALIAVIGVWLSSVAHLARTRRDAVATIQRAGGRVGYGWQWGTYEPHLSLPARALRWLVELVGDDSLGHPNFVELGDVGSDRMSPVTSDGSPSAIKSLLPQLRRLTSIEILLLYRSDVADDDLVELGDLPRLTDLDLAGTSITDAGLVHLTRMNGLQSLNLNRTAVTDAGLKNLEGLTALRWLSLRGTAVTEDAVGTLCRGLPGLKVDY